MDIGSLLGLLIGLASAAVAVLVSLVFTVASLVMPVAVVGLVVWVVTQQQRARRELVQSGIRARATVLSVRETGLRVNDKPQVKIDLQVFPPAAEPLQATVTELLSILTAPRVQPGAEVAVIYDGADPARMVLDLDAKILPDRTCRYCHSTVAPNSASCPSCGAGI